MWAATDAMEIGQRPPGVRVDSQATYLLDRHMFVLWTWSCRAVGAAPPVGDVETVALVVPTPDRSKWPRPKLIEST